MVTLEIIVHYFLIYPENKSKNVSDLITTQTMVATALNNGKVEDVNNNLLKVRLCQNFIQT